MLLTLQDLLRLYCTILLLMILHVLFEIYEAGHQREPEVIDQHDPAFVINPEVIRNRLMGWRKESENCSVRMRKNCATENDERQGWYILLFVQIILNMRGNSGSHKYFVSFLYAKQVYPSLLAS